MHGDTLYWLDDTGPVVTVRKWSDADPGMFSIVRIIDELDPGSFLAG